LLYGRPFVDSPRDNLKVYALKSPTGLKRGFALDELQAAIKDTTLGMAQLNVSYSNQ